MSVFFGTDGLRGVVGTELNYSIAYQCGNSLARQFKCKNVLIGEDTRTSGTYIACSIASGLMAGGVNVTYASVLPTAAVAYLTNKLGFDYGIAITASHNPKEYNGIKIFSSNGEKISEEKEELIERGFLKTNHVQSENIGRLTIDNSLKNKYLSFVLSVASCSLKGLKIVIDASNGAGYYLAPKVFSLLGAEVIKLSCKNDGEKINLNCGSLHPERLIEKVKQTSADLGLCFDGDADRLICVDENGNIVDGDHILTALARHLKRLGKLNQNMVVGTSMTNMGVEAELEKSGIKLIRADVGDKYVAKALFSRGLSLGGEQSGHIILAEHLRTGDGILTAVKLLCAFKESAEKFSKFVSLKVYPQKILNVCVKDKLRILGSEKLSNAISAVQQELAGSGRVLVRASGTEPKIRIMLESESEVKSNNLALYLLNVIKSLENVEGEQCVE